MLYRIIIIFIAGTLLFGCGSASKRIDPQKDLANIARVLKQTAPEPFKEKMNEFVAYAKSGDVEKMLSITSEITKEMMSVEGLREYYANDTVPFLQACSSLAEGGNYIYVPQTDPDSGEGWKIQKSCIFNEEESLVSQFIILEEQGKVVVASFGLAE